MSDDQKRRPMTLAQQRLLLAFLAIFALLASLLGAFMLPMTDQNRASALSIISLVIAGRVPEVYRHYFPTKSADDDKA